MSTAATQLRGPLVRAASNTASLLTTDVLNKATTFVVYALVARYTDTRAFGQLSLGLLLLYTFQVFACVGLPTLITRDLALNRNQTAKYFTHASFVVTCTALLSSLLMILLAWGLRFPLDTLVILAIFALALLPHALASVTESVFRAWERMHYIAYANVPTNLGKIVCAYALLRLGYGVVAIASMLVTCRVVIVLVEWAMLVVAIERPKAGLDLQCAKDLLSRGSTFLGIDGLIAILNSLDVILISKLCGETEVGLYSAACQLLVPAQMFFQSVVSSVFPMMCRKVRSNPSHLKTFVQWLIELLLMVGLPMSVALFFLAGPSLLLLYGNKDFSGAASIVGVLVVAQVFQTLITVLGHALWAAWREGTTLRITAINLLVNLVLGLVLIHCFGVIGAAVASLATRMVNAFQHYLAAAEIIGPLPMFRLAWKSLTAATTMAACLFLLNSTGMVLDGTLSLITYVAVLGVLVVHSSGGLQACRANYFSPLLNDPQRCVPE